MQRRALLSSLAVIGAVGTTGCLGNDRPGATLGTDSTEVIEQWGGEADRVVVSQGQEVTKEMGISASHQQITLPTGTIQFELENTTSRTFDTNPWAWKLWRREDEEWTTVFPEAIRKSLVHLDSGGSLEFRLTLDDTENVQNPYRRVGSPDSEHATLGDVESGEHALTLDGEFPSGKIRFVSRFGVGEDE